MILSAALPLLACTPQSSQDEAAAARQVMVTRQIAARGIRDPRVLEAMRTVPRHRFVPESWAAEAYSDHPFIRAENDVRLTSPFVLFAL